MRLKREREAYEAEELTATERSRLLALFDAVSRGAGPEHEAVKALFDAMRRSSHLTHDSLRLMVSLTAEEIDAEIDDVRREYARRSSPSSN